LSTDINHLATIDDLRSHNVDADMIKLSPINKTVM